MVQQGAPEAQVQKLMQLLSYKFDNTICFEEVSIGTSQSTDIKRDKVSADYRSWLTV